MTEDEARAWLAARYQSAAISRLEQFVDLLISEARSQSLIARSTLDNIWARHIVDSAQLLSLASGQRWLDVGSGAGLPGIVLTILHDGPVTLVEPRRRRADFLVRVIGTMCLTGATVEQRYVQRISGVFDVITARAVSAVSDLLHWTEHLVSRETVYVLPRGRGANLDMAAIPNLWQGTFHVEQSVTDSDAAVLVINNVTRQ